MTDPVKAVSPESFRARLSSPDLVSMKGRKLHFRVIGRAYNSLIAILTPFFRTDIRQICFEGKNLEMHTI